MAIPYLKIDQWSIFKKGINRYRWMNHLIAIIQIFRPPAPAGPAGLPPRRACPPTCPPSPTHGCTIDFKYNPDCHLLGKKFLKLEFRAVQKCVNLVDLEKCCKLTIWLPKSALIQPRTSLGKSDVSWPDLLSTADHECRATL